MPDRPPRFTRLLGALLVGLLALGESHAGAFGPRHVLVIGIDGLRSDALQVADAPNLHRLAAEGTVAWNAFAGGYAGTPTEQPTISGPGWGSILTGVWTDRHRLLGNNFAPYNAAIAARYPHFFRRLRETTPFASLASIVEWAPIDTALVAPVSAFTAFRQTALDGDTFDLAAKAAAHLAGADPDVLFLHFDAVDYAGHGSGFSPGNPAYLAAVREVDTGIGRVLDALDSRIRTDGEEWLILVTTDHGGQGKRHGGQSPEERTIFVIAHGPGVPAAVSEETPGHACIPATVAAFLGVPVDPSWDWDPTVFGYQPPPEYPLPAPVIVAGPTDISAFPGGTATFRCVVAGPEVKLQWTHDGRPVPDANGPTLILRDLRPEDSGEYVLSVENTRGHTLSSPALLRVMDPDTLDLATGLLTHLPLDRDYQDAGTGGFHGRPVGRPTLEAGRVGDGGVTFTTTRDAARRDHVRLGPEIVQRFAVGDFTVAFWMHAGTPVGDPPLVANKDWASGGNTGFVIALQPDGTFKFNLRGEGGSRVDANGGPVTDGAWHHVAVTCRRGGHAVVYRDGQPSASVDLTTAGRSIDSGLPLIVGQDGTGQYTNGGRAGIADGRIDEFALWIRALSAPEIAALYVLGLAGDALPGRPRLGMRTEGGSVILDWTGDGWHLQSGPSADAEWTDVPGTTTPPVRLPRPSEPSRFFRLVR